MMNPVLKAPGNRRGRLEDDQRNVCNGGLGRGDKRGRGQRQRVDVRNRANGGPGRTHKGRKGLQVVRLDRPTPYSKDQVMASGIDRVPEMREEDYEEACRLSRKRAAFGSRCVTPGCTAARAPKGGKCPTCRYLAKKAGAKRLQEEAKETPTKK